MSQDKKINTRIAAKADTQANWNSSDLVLYKNEVAYETDTGRYKIGDGTKTWVELPYPNFITTNEDSTNIEIPNVLFYNIPAVYVGEDEEILAYTINNWSDLLNSNKELLYDFFICSNQHWANSWQESANFEKIELDNFITYIFYSNGPDSYSNSLKINNNGEVYVKQSGWNGQTTRAVNILAIKKNINASVKIPGDILTTKYFDNIVLTPDMITTLDSITNYKLYDLNNTVLQPYLDSNEYNLEINLYTPDITMEDADLSILTQYNEIKKAYQAADLLGVINHINNTILIQGEIPAIDLIVQAKVVAK